MTPRQSFAIFCKTGFDVRACKLSMDEASQLITMDNETARARVATLPGAIEKRKASATKQDWATVYAEAHAAGMAAGRDCSPTPMVVEGYAPVMDGACGFASIVIRKGNSSFAVWLRKNNIGYHHYYGGHEIPMYEFGQSMERKMACASAMVKVLQKYGVDCYPTSRLD